MILERPDRLVFLLGAAAFLLALFFRRRSRLVVVPSLRIWEELLRPRRPRLRARLADAAATLLALAAFGALVLAAARPAVEKEAEARLDLVLVIDTASSLAARNAPGAPTRHEVAVAAAESLLATLRKEDRWALVVPDGGGTVAVPLHAATEPPLPASILARATAPLFAPADLEGALRLARAISERSENARVVVFTDGVGQGEEFVRSRVPDALLVDVGGPSSNRGFISLERESGPDGAERITVEIANAGPGDDEATLAWESEAGATSRRRISLPRGAAVTTTIEGRFGEGAALRLRLEPADLFPLDDELFVPAGPEPLPGVVVYVGAGDSLSEPGGDPFLQAALEAAAGVIDPRRIEYRAREPFAAPEGDDLAVFDGCDGPPEGFEGRPCLVFGSERPGLSLATAAAPALVAVLGFSIPHPVASGIPWDAFGLDRASPLFAVSESETVVRGTGGAIVAAGERAGARFAAFAFRPMDSDLRARPALPLLVRNAVRWVLRGGAARPAALARTGGFLVLTDPEAEPARVEGDGAESPVELRPIFPAPRPGASGSRIAARPPRPAPLGRTPPGLYLATWRRSSWRLGVNFLHRGETALGRPDARFAAPTAEGIRPRVVERRSRAGIVAAAGAVLLAASFLLGLGRPRR